MSANTSPRFYVRLVNEFWDRGPPSAGGRDRLIKNMHYLVKRGARWGESRHAGHFPEESALKSLSEAKRAANSSYVRQYGQGMRVEIVREIRPGRLEVIWRNPPLSPLEQLARCAK